MKNTDQSQTFLFDDTAIRGQIIHLNQSYLDVVDKKNYPTKIRHMLGEFLASVTALSSTLKFEGSLILQAKSQGQVRLIMAECKNREFVRAICHFDENFDEDKPLFEQGNLALTLEPLKGKPYQSLIALHEDNIAKGIEEYYLQSEQIKTSFKIAVNDNQASAMMIQAMPLFANNSSLQIEDESYNRVSYLFSTLKDKEILELPNQEILYRLFHEETVRVYDPKDLSFKCGCSRKRCENAVINLGLEDAKLLIQEQGKISVDCQFCNQHYSFKDSDLAEIFQPPH
ncbi:Hsp33 family molecular chaperone HslO [Marinicellulosiphila megalodicopiae]|uniref:Hsp33 family molecular chaperone HslO n=1 Tax=Marinicellulosiphila megalodicopiae TaxID=2724896 RepID=UPI003BAF4FA0